MTDVLMSPRNQLRHTLLSNLNSVCEAHSVTPRDVIGAGRDRPVAHARQALYFRLWMVAGWSTTRIGREMARDHSTVLYGIREHGKRMLEAQQ